MRSLRLISCGMAAAILTAASAAAQSPSAPAAAESADRFTNRELLGYSARDRRVWVNAFTAGMANAVALRDVETGRCVARWYSSDEGRVFSQIERSMEAYPSYRPAEVIFAVAQRACPTLVPES